MKPAKPLVSKSGRAPARLEVGRRSWPGSPGRSRPGIPGSWPLLARRLVRMMLSPTWEKGIFSVDLAVKRDPIKISNAVFSFYQKSLDSDKTG